MSNSSIVQLGLRFEVPRSSAGLNVVLAYFKEISEEMFNTVNIVIVYHFCTVLMMSVKSQIPHLINQYCITN